MAGPDERDAGAPPPGGQPRAHPVTSLSLLQRARGNDPDAWSRLFQLYRPYVLYWCGRWGVPAQDGEDVAQEVFRAAASGLDGFHRDRPGDSFRGWLRGITRYMVLQYFRRADSRAVAAGGSDAHQRLQEVSDPYTEEDPAEQLGALYHRGLELIRGDFEEQTWQAFWLTVVEGRRPSLVAPELGLSAGAVRQAKARVLRRLKEELGELIG
jgi:RNA polymerase sigma-70 factor (ECF subfamily)